MTPGATPGATPATPPDTKERDVLSAVIERTRKLGGVARRIAYLGRSGAPDLLLLIPRCQPLLVEVKGPKGKLSPIQASEHVNIAQAGHVVHVVKSFEDIDRMLPLNGGEPCR